MIRSPGAGAFAAGLAAFLPIVALAQYDGEYEYNPCDYRRTSGLDMRLTSDTDYDLYRQGVWPYLQQAGTNLREADLCGFYIGATGPVTVDSDGRPMNVYEDESGQLVVAAGGPSIFLRGADLIRANLTNARFDFADLIDAQLNGAVFTGASLSGAFLQNADLRAADLEEGVDLGGAHLQGAWFNRTTKLPREWGATFEERRQVAVSKYLMYDVEAEIEAAARRASASLSRSNGNETGAVNERRSAVVSIKAADRRAAGSGGSIQLGF